MSHIYRCNACRTRNTFPRAVTSYVRRKRCRNCLHDRFYVDRERINRKPCRCNAHHWPHRPGSPFCVSNPLHEAQRARRMGADMQVVFELELAARPAVAGGDECPF